MGSEHTPRTPRLVIQVSHYSAGRWTLSPVNHDAASVERVMALRWDVPLRIGVAVWPSEREQMVPIYSALAHVPPLTETPSLERVTQREAAIVSVQTALAFASFTSEWRRTGMPGEPHLEPDGAASVEVESWGARIYYRTATAAEALARFPTTEEADEETEGAICDALRAACTRSDPTCCSICGGGLTFSDPKHCMCKDCGAKLRRGDGDLWNRDTGARALVKDGVVLGMRR